MKILFNKLFIIFSTYEVKTYRYLTYNYKMFLPSIYIKDHAWVIFVLNYNYLHIYIYAVLITVSSRLIALKT